MNVPIIGQPRVGGWCLTLNVVCTCGTTSMLVGRMGSIATCENPECNKMFRLNGFQVNEQGALDVNLGLGIRQ